METRIRLDKVVRPLPPLDVSGDGIFPTAMAHLMRDPAFELVAMQVQLLLGTRPDPRDQETAKYLMIITKALNTTLTLADFPGKSLAFMEAVAALYYSTIQACTHLDPQFPPLGRLEESLDHAFLEFSKNGSSTSLAYRIEEVFGGKVPRLPPTMITLSVPLGTKLDFNEENVPVHTQRGVYVYEVAHYVRHDTIIKRSTGLPDNYTAIALVLA